ncbi:MAG: cupin domain-containing protein [Imperialibacter sp.]|uniref:cupin domain-containing protein n=1 Tax=Imperialibacter sp. TaxID=2038411 RepID=UPI0032EC6DE1
MNRNADYYIKQLNLNSHPEGGYFKETYRSVDVTTTKAGQRSISTAIYFLLEAGNFSAFHRIKSDEAWHFYDGEPLSIYVIHQNGTLEEIKLGLDLSAGQKPQAVVPANCWFASRVTVDGKFSLVGCTVAPGFDFQDFEMADRNTLITEYPQHQSIITSLTRN